MDRVRELVTGRRGKLEVEDGPPGSFTRAEHFARKLIEDTRARPQEDDSLGRIFPLHFRADEISQQLAPTTSGKITIRDRPKFQVLQRAKERPEAMAREVIFFEDLALLIEIEGGHAYRIRVKRAQK